MRELVSLLLFVAVFALAPPAAADLPPIPEFHADNVLVSPDGSLEYTIIIEDSNGPIDSALVQIVFSTETDALLCWCSGQTHPLVEAVTDATGEASFYIAAGGCVDSGLVASPPAVEVFVNGFKFAEVGVVSPDAVDDTGTKPLDGWDPGGTCRSVLSDAVYHTGPIVYAIYDFCSDMNSDLAVNLTDAVMITGPVVGASSCVRAP